MKRFFALGLVSVLLLGACGSDTDSEAPTSTPTQTAEETATEQATETATGTEAEHTDDGVGEPTDDSSSDGEEGAEDLDLPDPYSLTGVSEVPELPDPQPIEGDFSQELPVTVVDHEGNEVTVTDTSRILALDLSGSLTRTVIALGHGDSIVGRSISSTEEQLADLPVVTAEGHSLNAEAILNLRPTLIIADRTIGPPEVLQQLSDSGIPVVFTDPDHTLETNSDRMMEVAEALGVPEAGEALVESTEASVDAAIEEISAWAPEEPMDVAFLYVRGTAGVFFIFGSDNGTSALIESIGANDIASENGISGTVPANAESLLLLNPDVIFTMTDGLESTNGVDGLLARPGIPDTTAGKNQRIIAIPDGMSLSFGPQTAEVFLAVARALYGVDDAA